MSDTPCPFGPPDYPDPCPVCPGNPFDPPADPPKMGVNR